MRLVRKSKDEKQLVLPFHPGLPRLAADKVVALNVPGRDFSFYHFKDTYHGLIYLRSSSYYKIKPLVAAALYLWPIQAHFSSSLKKSWVDGSFGDKKCIYSLLQLTHNHKVHLAASEEVVVASALVRCSEDSEAGVHPDLYSGTGWLTWALRELVGTHDAKGEGGAEFL